jgi:hypothetical protein
MEIVESKVCGKCGRKFRVGTTRCPSCNVNFDRRAPRLLVGFALIVIFALFCSALYYFIHINSRAYHW